jgi:hypothetical protein
MRRKRPECPGSFFPDHSFAADVLVREEPDQEEDEDDGKDKDDDDDDENNDGYSE